MQERNPADANRITRDYLDSILVEERLIDAVTPNLTMELFGKTFQTPIMTPAFSHLPVYGEGREDGMKEYTRAIGKLGGVNWVGMMENAYYEEIAALNVPTVRVIKPYADRDKVLSQIECAEKCGALAVGVDTDHIFGNDGGYDLVVGERMRQQTSEDIREYVASTSLPFVIKGVLGTRDAVKCAELGVKGIVVSHHHGRLPYAVPPLMVLPEIVREIGKTGVKIFVDCSIDRGADAFKALALGADAVSVGRAMWPTLQEKGEQGLCDFVTAMNAELKMMMAFTGAASLKEIDPKALWINGRHGF